MRTREAVPNLTPEQRAARGRATRAKVPRASHALFDPPTSRPDPVSLLESQAAARVPELVPIRHARMMVSPFTFFRGAALVMAGDLAGTPRSGLVAQICGDAHLANFGVFATPERNLTFDVNDFDETLRGPWEWDVKRLVASLAIAARANSYPDSQRQVITMAAARGYREAMRRFAGMSNLDVWYARADTEQFQTAVAEQLRRGGRKQLAGTLAKARTRDHVQALGKLATVVDGELRIRANPPLIVPAGDLYPRVRERARFTEQISALMRGYRRSLEADRRVLLDQFQSVDVARKVVGVGSVGTRCWIVFMLGRDQGDPLFLQVKEARPSVLEEFLGASEFGNAGQRVVVGQRMMQASSDVFLGWLRADGLDGQTRDFYFRQLRDWKGSIKVESMEPTGMRVYGELCGWTLARAHARSGDRIAIAAYLGSGDSFDRAIGEFAEAYADRNERDYRAFTAAVAAGRIAADTGL